MSTLVVVAYPNEFQAEEVRLRLLKMQKEYLVDLEDAVIAIRKENGKVKVIRQSYDSGYVIRKQPNGVEEETDTPWQVYQEGTVLHLNPGERLLVNAKRIGYEENVKTFNF